MTPGARPALALLIDSITCHPATPAADVAGRVTTIAVPSLGRPAVARADTAGTIHLLCDSPDGPMHARLTDGGATFSAAIPVVTGDVRPSGLEYSAWDMAVGKGGRVHVAMATNAWKLKLPREEWGYYDANFDPDASAFLPVRSSNKRPGEGSSVTADEKGNVTACWLSDKLYANVSRDDGETFGPSVEIDRHDKPCKCCTASAAYDRPADPPCRAGGARRRAPRASPGPGR